MTAPADLANFAVRMFREWRAHGQRAFAAGKATEDKVNELVRPWLAIAVQLGADLPEVADHLAETVIFETGMDAAARARHAEMARLSYADRTATMAERRRAVAAERNHALDKLAAEATPEKAQDLRHRAALLVALAHHLGVTTPYIPANLAQPERTAA